jgi:hypothetical protein
VPRSFVLLALVAVGVGVGDVAELSRSSASLCVCVRTCVCVRLDVQRLQPKTAQKKAAQHPNDFLTKWGAFGRPLTTFQRSWCELLRLFFVVVHGSLCRC